MLTVQEMQIAEQRVQGKSLRQIEASTGINDATAARRLSKPEVKAYLEKLQAALINKTLPKAVGNIHSVVHKYLTAPDDSKRCEHGFKASLKVMEAAGLLPGNATSIYIQQIYNDNRTEVPESIAEIILSLTHRDQANKSLLAEPIDTEVIPDV
jgi:hypothetical protein